MQQNNKEDLLALSPFLVFILLYLVTSIVAGDFYKMPLTVTFMLSSIYAVAIRRGIPLKQRIDIFNRGAGASNLMFMIWIFVLAGAFANGAKAMGSIEAIVNLTMNLLPGEMLLPGLFLAACFISLSIGTSVGTIVALTPIAAGIATQTGIDIPMLTAVVVGGSFFGDNLSFISDTTIVATSSQGCKLSDKFRVNSLISIPAAILIFILYFFMGRDVQSPEAIPQIEYIKLLPYLTVLITAICGLNVMVVLTMGIMLTGIIGVTGGSFDISTGVQSMGAGGLGMGELIIITMMAGGMLALIKENGGLEFIIRHVTNRISSKRGAEFCIAGLVSMMNVCTANNTVAILTVGDIVKNIANRFGVDNRKSASILDTMSCCVQGIIPYGAQILMAAGLASVNPLSIIPHLYYPLCLGVITLLAIALRYPKKYS